MSKEDTEFLKKNFNPYLVPLLRKLMAEQPENSYKFICDWLDTEGRKIKEELKNF